MLSRLDWEQFQQLRPRLHKLYLEAYRLLPEYAYEDPDQALAYMDWLYRGDPTGFFVARADGDNGVVVGFAGVHGDWTERGGRVVAELHELAVDPQWQGRGVGRALLDRAIEYARQIGREAMGLWVGEKNRRAEAIYRRAGFRRTGKWGNWVRMELSLTPSERPAPVTTPQSRRPRPR